MTADSNGSPNVRAGHVVTLLASIALLLVVSEIATTRVAIPVSRLEGRIVRAIDSAHAVHGPRTMLFVGNSLLIYGLADSVVGRMVPAPWTARRVGIEQTTALDWKYGLRRLWADGARPEVFGVVLSARQLVTSDTRSDYTALRLTRARDVIAFGRDAGFDRTEISRLVLSHFSSYFGFRKESRKVLLSRVIPGMAELTQLMLAQAAAPLDSSEFRRTAEARLIELRASATQGGARFVFIVPPVPGNAAEVRALLLAAKAVGVETITQDLSRPYVEEDFVDGFHLSARGAERWDEELRVALLQSPVLAAKTER